MCDATRTVPCPNFAASPVDLGTVADGQRELGLVATGSAGQHDDGDQARGRRRQRTNRGALAREPEDDHGLGLRRRVRRRGRGDLGAKRAVSPFRAVPTTLANGRLTAKLDRGSASRVGVSVSVRTTRAMSPWVR